MAGIHFHDDDGPASDTSYSISQDDYQWERMIVQDGVRRDAAKDRGRHRECMAEIHFHDDKLASDTHHSLVVS